MKKILIQIYYNYNNLELCLKSFLLFQQVLS